MLKLPIRLTRMTRSNASSFSGPSRPTIRPAVPIPAQFTRMRTGPCGVAGGGERGLARGCVGDVAADADPADRGGLGLGGRLVDVDHGHLGAQRRQMRRRRRAQAGPAACHQCRQTFDLHHFLPPPLDRRNHRAAAGASSWPLT